MTYKTLLPTSLLALVAALALQTAAAGPPTDVVAKYDKDNDKTLDWNEVKDAAAAEFDRLDTNGDHSLDAKEAAGILGPKAFAAADADHDGTLSKEEYLRLAEKLFKQADADHDGTLTADELDSKSGKVLARLIGRRGG